MLILTADYNAFKTKRYHSQENTLMNVLKLWVFSASYNVLPAHVSYPLILLLDQFPFPTRCHFYLGFRPCSWHLLLPLL